MGDSSCLWPEEPSLSLLSQVFDICLYVYSCVACKFLNYVYNTYTRMCCIYREVALLCAINQVEENSMLLACVETRTTIAIVCEIYS